MKITRSNILSKFDSQHLDTLLEHFNEIYECKELGEDENNLIFLAWLLDTGFAWWTDHGANLEALPQVELDTNVFEGLPDGEAGVNFLHVQEYYALDDLVEKVSRMSLYQSLSITFHTDEDKGIFCPFTGADLRKVMLEEIEAPESLVFAWVTEFPEALMCYDDKIPFDLSGWEEFLDRDMYTQEEEFLMGCTPHPDLVAITSTRYGTMPGDFGQVLFVLRNPC